MWIKWSNRNNRTVIRMTTEPRSIQVLVVSRDVSILHEIAWMLDAVGYDVQTSTDTDQEALWHRYSLADMRAASGESEAIGMALKRRLIPRSASIADRNAADTAPNVIATTTIIGVRNCA